MALFSPVPWSWIKKTGESKGFGFVEMPNQGAARVAMKNLNGQEVDGFKIRVKKAEAKPAQSHGD